jgi:DNA-binding NtrC family response regulator
MAAILTIDDNPVMRNAVVLALTEAGHAVVAVARARDGLDILKTVIPDLVITDLIMPDKDGIELITELRRILPDLPIIAISGGSSLSSLYLKMAKQLGAVKILLKPFSVEALSEAVDGALKFLG